MVTTPDESVRARDPESTVLLACFDEEGCIERLVREVHAVLAPLGRTFEILVVDDGSADRSAAIVERLARDLDGVRLVRHRRNFGQSAAQATGFRHARGTIVVTMDADGQNDPASIPDLLRALDGHDAVCGVRVRRQDDWVRRASSLVGNGFRNLVTGDRVTDSGCAFRALRRAALAEIPAFNGMHRFLPTLLRYQGLRVTEVPVLHRPRTTGRSKYGIGNRLFRGVLDCFAMLWLRRRLFASDRVAAGWDVETTPAPIASRAAGVSRIPGGAAITDRRSCQT